VFVLNKCVTFWLSSVDVVDQDDLFDRAEHFELSTKFWFRSVIVLERKVWLVQGSYGKL
jgi:hypothetical protein